MEPLLFGTIGTSIVFSQLNPSTIPKSICIVLSGEGGRVWGAGLLGERQGGSLLA
jgi:hypothetical protein